MAERQDMTAPRDAEEVAADSMILDGTTVPCRVCGEEDHPFESHCTLCGAIRPIRGRYGVFNLKNGDEVTVSIAVEPGRRGYCTLAIHHNNRGIPRCISETWFPESKARAAIEAYNHTLWVAGKIALIEDNPVPNHFAIKAGLAVL